MKIGILTHHYINNFGAFLQAYSLLTYIGNLRRDDDVQIINYINQKHFIINSCGWLRFYKDRETFKIWKKKLKVSKMFADQRRKWFRLSAKCTTAKAVEKMNFDYIIVGSDEVWNYCDSKANDKIKFGFGLSCKGLVAYAPSVGQAEGNIPQYVVDGIKKFKAVSARDDLTEKILKSLRDDVVRVVDPTFLIDIPVEPVVGIEGDYILFYYCDGLPRDEKIKIIEYARAHSLKVYGAGEGDKEYSDITVDITPFQWVWMFKNAKWVITGTFHGVVFSLLNHRNFACYLTNPSRIAKVNSLLAECDLQDRITDGDAQKLIQIAQKDVDYAAFIQKAKEKIAVSKNYLGKVFENV